jgi:hypothetical protein
MSDYFALLAARLAGAPDSVRPRTPARFEPRRRDDAAGVVDATPAVVRETEGVLLDETREELASVRRPAPRHTRPRRRDVSHVEEPPGSDEAEHVTSRHASPPRKRTSTLADLTRDMADRDANTVAQSNASRDESRAVSPAPRRSDDHRREEAPPLASSPRSPARAATAIARTPSPEGQPHRVAPDHVRREAPDVRSTAAPSIQITIGRIEIQAVMPQTTPPPAPRRSEAPTLTLDAYLTRRNGPEP